MYPAPYAITVRHNPAVPGIMTALGALTLISALTLLSGPFGAGAIGFLISGIISLTIGILQFAKPYCVYEPATGALRMIDLFGYKDKIHGTPVGEHLYFNGRNLIRVLPHGAQTPVKTWPGHAADLPHLYAAVPYYPA
jgi:hypothetical protein